MTPWNCSSRMPITKWSSAMPAFTTRTSIGPCRSLASRKARDICWLSATSHSIPWVFSGAPLVPRWSTATRSPLCWNSLATARPIPRLPPVTSTERSTCPCLLLIDHHRIRSHGRSPGHPGIPKNRDIREIVREYRSQSGCRAQNVPMTQLMSKGILLGRRFHQGRFKSAPIGFGHAGWLRIPSIHRRQHQRGSECCELRLSHQQSIVCGLRRMHGAGSQDGGRRGG